MQVIRKDGVPIKLWGEDIESGAIDQMVNLSKLPFAYKWVAGMPDMHQGYGMPIGGVLAAEGQVIPNAVGVDIGCGMCAVKTSHQELSDDQLLAIVGQIYDRVPVGFNWNTEPMHISASPNDTPIVDQQFERARLQVGTLGGGNHFIEIQKGSNGWIYVMVHSGSRNLGARVAKYYNDVAIEFNAKWHSSVPKGAQLAHLPIDSEEGQQYLAEMDYCVGFALANRIEIVKRVERAFQSVVATSFDYDNVINIAHNFARMEHHYGKNVMVHRKGATPAYEGQLGIIPGSQGTSSYIVRGKGNEESFRSCSHGAGRKLSRSQAKKVLDLADEQSKLVGIVHYMLEQGQLDEAPGAYKDIDRVMELQSDLVDIVVKLQPLGVVKG